MTRALRVAVLQGGRSLERQIGTCLHCDNRCETGANGVAHQNVTAVRRLAQSTRHIHRIADERVFEPAR